MRLWDGIAHIVKCASPLNLDGDLRNLPDFMKAPHQIVRSPPRPWSVDALKEWPSLSIHPAWGVCIMAERLFLDGNVRLDNDVN